MTCHLLKGHAGNHMANGYHWTNPTPAVPPPPPPRKHDPINHPAHYTNHPSGIECIQIVEHMGFCRGNAIKYIWRAGEKGPPIDDLRKAVWYLEREIKRLERGDA